MRQLPKLVVTDLDGTFLSPDGTVSAENRAAVEAANDVGLPVLFATGRPVRWLDVVRDLPGAHPTVIASNGAVLYDLGADRVLDRVCLDPDVTSRVVQAIRTAVPSASFAFESGSRFGYEPTYRTVRVDDGTDPTIFCASVEDLAARTDCVKLLVQDRSQSSETLLAEVVAAAAGEVTATHSMAGASGLVEISGPGVSKASMLERYCARLGVEACLVAAFGDMPNDVDMLSWAGMPHVVANGHPLLLAGAYRVVPGNHESGVGRTIAGWASALAAEQLAAPRPVPPAALPTLLS